MVEYAEQIYDIDERLLRLELMLDRLGIRLGSSAHLRGSTWELSEFQIAQWVAGTILPLGDSSSYVRLKDGNLGIRGGQFDIHTGESGAHMTLTSAALQGYNAAESKTIDMNWATGSLWASKGGFGGTLAAPLLALDEAGTMALGGWAVAATSLSANNATLSSTGYISLGTTNDLLKMSATDATYRFWVGHATAASAPFILEKTGSLTSLQGTGTLGVDFTGIRQWKDTGVGRIAGYYSDVMQWYSDTSGKLHIVGGSVTLETVGSPTYSLLQDWVNTTQSAGLISGGTVTATSYAIKAADEVANTFTIEGNVTAYFTNGVVFTVSGSTGNNGDYTTAGNSTYAAGDTTVTVASVVDGTDDGNIADGRIDCSAVTGMVKKTNDLIDGVTAFLDCPAAAYLLLTDQATNWIYGTYGGGTPAIAVEATLSNIDDATEFTIARVWRDGTEVHLLNSGTFIYNATQRAHRRIRELRAVERASGAVITDEGTLHFSLDAGVLYSGLDRFTTDAFNSLTTGKFMAWYHNGAGGWVHTARDQTTIDSANYDTGTGLTAVDVARYGVHWVYLDHDSHVQVVYGRDSYKLQEAQVVALPAVPTLCSDFATLVAKIIVYKDDTEITEVDSAFKVVFQAISPVDHGELSNVTSGQHHAQAHVLSGADHTASGLTAGYVVRASAAAAFAWAQLQHSDLGGVTSDLHHARQHGIVTAADHTVAGSALDVIGLSASNTLAVLTPSASPGAASALLKSDASGYLQLTRAGIGHAPQSDSYLVAGNPGLTAVAGSHYGVNAWVASDPAGASAAYIYGFQGSTSVKAANAQNHTNTLAGVRGIFYHFGTGTISTARGAQALVQNASVGIVSDLRGVDVALLGNTGTITSTYGIYIGSMTAGTQTNQAWGLYGAGANDRNYFAGSLAIDGGLNLGTATGATGGSAGYSGDLRPYRNSTLYTGYAFVPLATPALSASWDGDAKGTANRATIDLSAVFGLPAGIKAVSLKIAIVDNTVGTFVEVGANSSSPGAIRVENLIANQYNSQSGVSACDANGDIYFYASADGIDAVYIEIYGYWI